MQEVSFDGISECYDFSRDVPAEVIQGLIDCLNEVGILKKNQLVVDVACGTGRYLKPFASAFINAIGIDISEEMIDIARQKCKSLKSVKFVKGDARSMSIPSAAADVVISSKLFLHVREWKRIVAEIERITKVGGYFIHINETGLFNNKVRIKFRELCKQTKMNFGFLGEVNLDKVGQWIEETGYHRVDIADQSFDWEHQVTYSEAYEALRNRSFAEFQQISDVDYQTVLDTTSEWICDQPNGWDTIQKMYAKLCVDIFQKTRIKK